MRMRCICGPNDGEYWEVPDTYKYGDLFKIAPKPELSVVSLGAIIDTVTTKYYEYIIDRLYFINQDDAIFFLRYKNMSTCEAVRHQFNK